MYIYIDIYRQNFALYTPYTYMCICYALTSKLSFCWCDLVGAHDIIVLFCWKWEIAFTPWAAAAFFSKSCPFKAMGGSSSSGRGSPGAFGGRDSGGGGPRRSGGGGSGGGGSRGSGGGDSGGGGPRGSGGGGSGGGGPRGSGGGDSGGGGPRRRFTVTRAITTRLWWWWPSWRWIWWRRS